MRITRLRLNGFKSFVDPTELVVADGLTGVVGPNGCGKSNLLEALRWVMGENRPTAMRGGGMEDVIFAGAATRPARNFAEVALTIDNSERRAPVGFNEEDWLEITRRITRDVGSAYRANAREVRARDVQMLFADASTGAHSPALVRQGQISELINAKPKSRRRVLEEAAGISGLYQRRHEAELKLRGAEQNLARVDDVIEQFGAQLAQLARQARQAARYREIGEALRRAEGLLLWRRWGEADAARLDAAEALRARMLEASRAESEARRAGALAAERSEALPALREEDATAAAILQRYLVERDTLTARAEQARETLEALRARAGQLGADTERETALTADAEGSIERLKSEIARLEEAGTGHEAQLARRVEEAEAASAAFGEAEAQLAERTEDVARLAARHQSAERLVADSRLTLERSTAEAERAARASADAARAAEEAAAAEAAAGDAEARATDTARRAEEVLGEAEAARAAIQEREAMARATHSEAEGEAAALRAEAAALARLVARDTAETGQIIDDLRVEPGFEAALGAALADDLRAPQVEGDAPSGWAALPDYEAVQPLPGGVEPLAARVAAPRALARRLAQVGLVADGEGAAMQADLLPGQRLVSPAGDLWRWDGFRSGAEDAPSAAALRLQQLNRLTDLKRDLEEASGRAAGARDAHARLAERLAVLSKAEGDAREARRAADRQLTEAARARSRAEADRSLAEGRLEAAGLARARHEEEAAAAAAHLAEAGAALEALEDLAEARSGLDDARAQRDRLRGEMMARREAAEAKRREGAARSRRLKEAEAELAKWSERAGTAAARIAELAERRDATLRELARAEAAPGEIAAAQDTLAGHIAEAEARRAAAADALSAAEGAARAAAEAERAAERAASEAREARARAEALAESAETAVAEAAQRIEEAQGLDPAALAAALAPLPEPMPGAEAAEAEVSRLKRQREALGAVNLRAEEDAREVQAEHDRLTEEKADLEAAIRTLRGGIASLNREGRERLLTAFEQVNENFSFLFTHLFGGGEARLELVESEDPLDAGLEILCQPPGKRLSTLSLLSGGEQTLTALALIFAVFLSNPAPICVLDEVDAPLDDANVTRFCDLLDEMCRRTQTRFLIITHHAITMARMDRLFGVTMVEQGVSQLVSVDLKRAEAMVA